VARELKLSPEKVNLICQSFHDGLREYLKHPDKCKGGIIIPGFLSFNFKSLRMEESIKDSILTKELKETVINNVNRYGRTNGIYAKVKKKQTRQ